MSSKVTDSAYRGYPQSSAQGKFACIPGAVSTVEPVGAFEMISQRVKLLSRLFRHRFHIGGLNLLLLEFKTIITTLIQSFKFEPGVAPTEWLLAGAMAPYPVGTKDLAGEGVRPGLPLKLSWLITISALRGPENLGSAPALAIVGEHSGAFGMRPGSACGVLSTARREILIRRVLTRRFPKPERSRALPGFWGLRRDNTETGPQLTQHTVTNYCYAWGQKGRGIGSIRLIPIFESWTEVETQWAPQAQQKAFWSIFQVGSHLSLTLAFIKATWFPMPYRSLVYRRSSPSVGIGIIERDSRRLFKDISVPSFSELDRVVSDGHHPSIDRLQSIQLVNYCHTGWMEPGTASSYRSYFTMRPILITRWHRFRNPFGCSGHPGTATRDISGVSAKDPLSVSQSEWGAFNATLGGRLGRGVPFARDCFESVDFGVGPAAPGTQCSTVQAKYPDNAVWPETSSMSSLLNILVHAADCIFQTQWEICQKTSEGCLLDSNNPTNSSAYSPPAVCHQGSVSPYYVDVRNPNHAVKAFEFSKRTGVPLSIKNTGASRYEEFVLSLTYQYSLARFSGAE
ncbi:hypothetical protein AG1IA_01542 [Rhizoctonia solani AG-1 IA]|uniref:Uncharacterized protein n=1 Tax=Thanatephorus cucumeris (strain AG1-IA) TaxID=983506 RepID=L8X716_THACA|nr:hypothetical protein AG1IA_01542 [Rhizoctonia solani AG-1 IA]